MHGRERTSRLKPTPSELRALARRDPVLGRAMKRLPAFPGFPDGSARAQRTHFHALARAIVYQQLATKAAATIHARVCALTPGCRFPRAEELLALPEERLRGAGLSRNKLLSLRDLATRVSSGELDLRRVGRLPDEQVIEELVAVRGIGTWSAQMFLLFRLGRLDVMPATDLGVQEGLRRLDGRTERPTPKEVLARSEPWRPLCSVASWYLWRLVEAERAG
jgi:3-methyladenine DNA glycosylase/8-oxoguanine DNA glycosylase